MILIHDRDDCGRVRVVIRSSCPGVVAVGEGCRDGDDRSRERDEHVCRSCAYLHVVCLGLDGEC